MNKRGCVVVVAHDDELLKLKLTEARHICRLPSRLKLRSTGFDLPMQATPREVLRERERVRGREKRSNGKSRPAAPVDQDSEVPKIETTCHSLDGKSGKGKWCKLAHTSVVHGYRLPGSQVL